MLIYGFIYWKNSESESPNILFYFSLWHLNPRNVNPSSSFYFNLELMKCTLLCRFGLPTFVFAHVLKEKWFVEAVITFLIFETQLRFDCFRPRFPLFSFSFVIHFWLKLTFTSSFRILSNKCIFLLILFVTIKEKKNHSRFFCIFSHLKKT